MIKGVPVETGTYVWQLSFTDPRNGRSEFDKGSSILLR